MRVRERLLEGVVVRAAQLYRILAPLPAFHRRRHIGSQRAVTPPPPVVGCVCAQLSTFRLGEIPAARRRGGDEQQHQRYDVAPHLCSTPSPRLVSRELLERVAHRSCTGSCIGRARFRRQPGLTQNASRRKIDSLPSGKLWRILRIQYWQWSVRQHRTAPQHLGCLGFQTDFVAWTVVNAGPIDRMGERMPVNNAPWWVSCNVS
jgi:hypothetical protein